MTGRETLQDKLRARARRGAPRLQPLLLPPPADEEYWERLSDILQAQVLVAIETVARKTMDQRLPPERVLWAAAPHLRTATILRLLLLWSVMLAVPVVLLVELVGDIGDTGIDGGWVALAWAVVSVFIFVPKVSRPSREVFVLTSRRAFVSRRTMWCSIETEQLELADVTAADLAVRKGGVTGTLTLVAERRPAEAGYRYEPDTVVTFSQVLDLRGMCRVLDSMLPPSIAQKAGIRGEGEGVELDNDSIGH